MTSLFEISHFILEEEDFIMGTKYEFTGETMNYEGYLLHKIRRLPDGKLGGWIQSENNLS